MALEKELSDFVESEFAACKCSISNWRGQVDRLKTMGADSSWAQAVLDKLLQTQDAIEEQRRLLQNGK
jgi:hypothetical protein